MRRKATVTNSTQLSALGNGASEKSEENTHLKVIKQIERPSKTPAGKGLGKAGAKRLGRLLKRAGNAPKTNSAKPTSPHISQLILSVVSQCKHRGGISMAELKQMLAAGGYDVAKNNRRVNIETKRLVNNETLVRTTRNASFRLNHKVISTKCSTAKLTDIIQVRTIPVKTPKPKAELKLTPKTATSKSPKGAENQKRRVLKPNQTKPKNPRNHATQKKKKERKRYEYALLAL
uniref:H15 domain-containing protein n=1 Tax=Maylandia zebra TaxID=106582 RepID=A0A3P9CMW9_9CICH